MSKQSPVAGPVPHAIPAAFLDYTMVTGINETGKGVAQMGVAVSFPSPVDRSRVSRAFRLLLDAEPVLGCSLDLQAGVWRRVSAEELERAFGTAESNVPDTDAIAFAAAPIDPTRGPQARALLVRAANRDTLVLKATHSAVDSQAVIAAAGLIGRLYRELGRDPDWVLKVNSVGVRDFASLKTGMSLLERYRFLRAEDVNDPPTDWRIPYRFERGGETYAFAAVVPESLRSAKAKGRERGATVNDLLITALYRTLWSLLDAAPEDKTPLMATADIRGAFPAGTVLGLGNFSTSWWLRVSPVVGEDFDGTLRRVMVRTADWKNGRLMQAASAGMGSVEGWMSGWRGRVFRRMLLGGVDGAKAKTRSTPGRMAPVLSNIGVIDEGAVDFGPDAPVEYVRFFGPIGLGPWLGLSASTYRDRLELSTGFDAEALDPGLMQAIVDGAAEELLSWSGGAA